MKLFGKAQKAPKPTDAIGKLKDTLSLLEKRDSFLQEKVQKELALAKQHASKNNKKLALQCLKRKRLYETQMQKLDGARYTIEQQVASIENMVTSLEALSAMKAGSRAMTMMQDQIGGAKEVDDTMLEIQEGIAMADEISESMSQSIGSPVDEDELLEELRQLELEDDMLDAHASSEKLLHQLPAAPSGVPKAPPSVPVLASSVPPDEDDFAKLTASMS